MTPFKLLIIEDNQQDMQVYKDTIQRYMDEKKKKIELTECLSSSDIDKKLNNSFDAAVIDIRIEGDNTKGTQIVQQMEDSYFRIPLAIITGTPGHFDLKLPNVRLYKKGETQFFDILNDFFELYDTGITKIIGGRGKIAETLKIIFDNHLLPYQKSWISYGKNDRAKTEVALLRYTLNHLLELLNDDENLCFPEEVYIYPPLSKNIKTGSIVKSKANDDCYVALSPACDLVPRKNNMPKTDRILLAAIEPDNKVLPVEYKNIRKLLKNTHTYYWHWLPPTNYFAGGFINFRTIISQKFDEFQNLFNPPKIQISSFFIKDIISRFSSYYARQGQPDIDSENLVETYLRNHNETQQTSQ